MTTREPLPSDLSALAASRHTGGLATIKRDGRPQLSMVSYAFDPAAGVARISTRAPLAKVANLRRDHRASLLVPSDDQWSYAVLEGHAELSEVSRDEHDATVEELVEVYRAIGGEHPDWDDYRQAMVRDERLVVRLVVERGYGLVR